MYYVQAELIIRDYVETQLRSMYPDISDEALNETIKQICKASVEIYKNLKGETKNA
jgi:predicted secreted protein